MKQVCLWLALVALVVLAGCSSQDFGRPIARIGDVVDSGKAYVDDGSSEESMRRASQLAQILAAWERQKVEVDEDYTLGPDDELTIGILSLETPDQVSTLTRTISKDGTVSLPLVGAVACTGLTARGLQDRIVASYRGDFLQDPQVDVAVAEYRSAPVVVTGAVGQPGVYYLRHNQSSVLEVLSMANGLSAEAGNDLLVVRRRRPSAAQSEAPVAPEVPALVPPAPAAPAPPEVMPEPWTGSHIADLVMAMQAEDDAVAVEGAVEPEEESSTDIVASQSLTTEPEDVSDAVATNADEPVADDLAASEGELDADLITVDLERLLDEGDVRLNLPIMGGDIVTVPPGRQEYVYVLGYVQRPGAFDLGRRQRVRALQAVAMAGGLAGAARAQNSFLIIDNPTGRKVVSVDLTKIARGQRPPVYMESGHTLVVGSGVFARLAEFIRPSVSAGANLTPGP